MSTELTTPQIRRQIGEGILESSLAAKEAKKSPLLANVFFQYKRTNDNEKPDQYIVPNVSSKMREELKEAGLTLSANSRGIEPFSKALAKTSFFSDKELEVLRALEAILPLHRDYKEQIPAMLGNPLNVKILSNFIRYINGPTQAEAVLISMIPEIVDAHQLKADIIIANKHDGKLKAELPIDRSQKIKEIRSKLPSRIRSSLGIIQAIYRSHGMLDTYGMLKVTNPKIIEDVHTRIQTFIPEELLDSLTSSDNKASNKHYSDNYKSRHAVVSFRDEFLNAFLQTGNLSEIVTNLKQKQAITQDQASIILGLEKLFDPAKPGLFLTQLAERKLPILTPFEVNLIKVASQYGQTKEATQWTYENDLIDIRSLEELTAYLSELKDLLKGSGTLKQSDQDLLFKSIRSSLPIELNNTLSCLEVYWKTQDKKPSNEFFQMNSEEFAAAHEKICEFREKITPQLFGCAA